MRPEHPFASHNPVSGARWPHRAKRPKFVRTRQRDRADIRENWVYTPAELEKLADYLEEESPRRDTDFHLGPARALGHSGTAGTQLERAS